MFGDAFKRRLALLYTEFPTDPSNGYVKRRNRTDVEAVMNADIVDLAKLDCIVTHGDCFFTENYPACPTEEQQLRSVISGLVLWGLSRTPMSTADFNGLEDMEKTHKLLQSTYFASYWQFPYRLERISDPEDGQEYLELVNVRFPWRYQTAGKVLTFGLLGWNSVITRLRLLGVSPTAELNLKLGRIYSLKYILDSLVSQGDRLFMTSLKEDKKDIERGRIKEHIVSARCTFKKVKKFVGK
jgi:hypothetical protein